MFDGQQFTHNGHMFRVETKPDESGAAPWGYEDGHGPVSDWRRSGYTGRPRKAPGEMILIRDRGWYRTYDFQAAVKQAKAEGWDAPPYGGTRGERAHRAAMADFQRLRDWCDGRWYYIGVVVHLLDDMGDDMGESESLRGIESDADDYLDEVAQELADEIIDRLAKTLAA